MKRNKTKLFKGTLILGLSMSLLVSCNGTNNVYTISFYDDETLISTINTKGNEIFLYLVHLKKIIMNLKAGF